MKIKHLPFVLLALMTVLLGVATFVEAQFGTPFVQAHFYGSWWMLTLWIALALSAMYLCFNKLKKRKPALLLHISFAVILLGALITFLFAERGQVHLRENSPPEQTETSVALPFKMRLEKFVTDYYTGTTTPADYISHLVIYDKGLEFEAVVSMNNIFRYRGFRFYQASYDSDGKGAILSVCYDPFGIAVTYAGYMLLALAMLLLLVSKNGAFRRLIRSLGVIALIIMPLSVNAQRTLNKDEAKAFGKIAIFYHGRISPLDTYAHDFTLKITGKASYKEFDAVQVFAGWLFFPDDWQDEKMIKIKDKEIRRLILGGNESRARLSDFFNSGVFKLTYANLPLQHKGMKEVDEKMSLLMSLHSGASLKIFPVDNQWLSPDDELTSLPDDDRIFVSKFITLLAETVEKEDHQQILRLIDKLSVYQQKSSAEGAISPIRTRIEIFYNGFDAVGMLFKINIAVGLLAFFFFVGNLLTGRKHKFITVLAYVQIIHSLAFLSLIFGLRWYIASHIPLSNGYETMIFVSLCILIFAVLLARGGTGSSEAEKAAINRKDFIPAIGLLLSGLTLLVASLGAMNPAITQLVPVLQSPWLSIHVSLIMISYALLGFMFFNGVTALILRIIGNNVAIEILYTLSRILLYPALFTLAAGIFVGAVWANVSWGRYWGWDPKEVWALVTMLVYSLAMHPQTLKPFQKPLFFHIYSILAFLTVIMTYFGVNLFLGGMHSY